MMVSSPSVNPVVSFVARRYRLSVEVGLMGADPVLVRLAQRDHEEMDVSSLQNLHVTAVTQLFEEWKL